MNLWYLAAVIIATPIVITGLWWWVAWYLSHDDPPLRCDCQRRVLRGGHAVFDHTDLLMHGVTLCQPNREWIDD